MMQKSYLVLWILSSLTTKNRLEYAGFINEAKGNLAAKSKAEELMEEIHAMDSYEKGLNKKVIKEIKHFYQQIIRQN